MYGSLPATTPSFGSREVNGQLVPVFVSSAFTNVGNAVGPRLQGYGVNTPATIPLTPGSATAGSLPAMGGTALKLTPRTTIVLAIMFVVGFSGLRYIHWRA